MKELRILSLKIKDTLTERSFISNCSGRTMYMHHYVILLEQTQVRKKYQRNSTNF